MAKHFDLRKQLKLHDKGLLRRLFAEQDVLRDFSWESLKPHDVEPLVKQWEGLAEETRRVVQVILQDVNELADDRGQRILAEELSWRHPHKVAEFSQLKSLYDKALWAYLETRDVFDEAALFARAESLRTGQFANRWNSLPTKTIQVTDDLTEALQDAIRAYYWENELRGHACRVHHYTRADGTQFFFAYLPDWPDRRLVFDPDGHLTTREEAYAFSNVFIYTPSDGALELIAKGARRSTPPCVGPSAKPSWAWRSMMMSRCGPAIDSTISSIPILPS